MIRDDPEALAAFREAMKHQGERTDLGNNVPEVERQHRGNRRAYSISRVQRECDPDTVAGGMAWHFTRYSDDAGLAAAEVEARDARRGLWADARPVPPWEWRASEKERKAAKRQPAGR